MRLLLDTHVVLWQVFETRSFGPRALAAIAAADDSCGRIGRGSSQSFGGTPCGGVR